MVDLVGVAYMAAVDDVMSRVTTARDALPEPRVGEAVLGYWLRMLQWETWADSHDHCTSIGCPNPYDSQVQL